MNCVVVMMSQLQCQLSVKRFHVTLTTMSRHQNSHFGNLWVMHMQHMTTCQNSFNYLIFTCMPAVLRTAGIIFSSVCPCVCVCACVCVCVCWYYYNYWPKINETCIRHVNCCPKNWLGFGDIRPWSLTLTSICIIKLPVTWQLLQSDVDAMCLSWFYKLSEGEYNWDWLLSLRAKTDSSLQVSAAFSHTNWILTAAVVHVMQTAAQMHQWDVSYHLFWYTTIRLVCYNLLLENNYFFKSILAINNVIFSATLLLPLIVLSANVVFIRSRVKWTLRRCLKCEHICNSSITVILGT